MLEDFAFISIMAISTAAAIVLLALAFYIKQWIAISTFCLLLLFSLLTGTVIGNIDIIRYHFSGSENRHTLDLEMQLLQLKEQHHKIDESFKSELEVLKRQLKILQEDVELIKNQRSPSVI